MTYPIMKRAGSLALAVVVLSGCGILKKRQPEPVASATAVAAAQTAPTASAPAVEPAPVVVADALPTPEDFEDEAFEKVTDKTYKAELASLKQELEAK
jgi:PBP1b-binding outer membrane lipoprotein LpoB